MPKKGYKQSEEHRQKISKARIGMKFSDEHKRKLGLAKMGDKNPNKRLENRRKISESMKGEKNHQWKGGIKPIPCRIRHSLEYKLWRKAIFERDNYTCIWCGDDRGGNLQADHIKPFAYYPELRFAIDNGRTLCKECHKKTDTYGVKCPTRQ